METIIEFRRIDNPEHFARFTWNDECTECSFVEHGLEDGELEAMVETRAYEGADFDGFTWTIE